MSDINKVTLRGRAAANAEWKDLPNTTLVTLRVATSDDYTDRDGRKVERTDWHMVACWGKVAEQATGIRKGDVVTVEGQLRTRWCECRRRRRSVHDHF
jgi:single-strand DNA-binding protein